MKLLLIILAQMFLSTGVFASGVEFTGPSEKHPSWSFADVGLIPMQTGGRIKPLDTFAPGPKKPLTLNFQHSHHHAHSSRHPVPPSAKS